jgi:hypothetical protein
VKKLLTLALVAAASALSSQTANADFRCSFYGTPAPSGEAIVVDLTVNGRAVPVGRADRNGARWSLSLGTERLEGDSFLELNLMLPRQNAAVASSRASLTADLIGLTVQVSNNIASDIVCKRLK